MLILAVLVLGIAAGWAAQLIVNRGKPVNWSQTLGLGLIGSFVGGLLASLLAGDGLDLRPSGLVGSIVGATFVLAAGNAIRSRSRR